MYFSYESTELMIPVSAPDEESAKMKLRAFFEQWSQEMAVGGPVISPVQRTARSLPRVEDIPAVAIPSEALSLRIEELIKDCMPIKKPAGAQSLEKLVKTWTGFPYEPQNFQAIIGELEKIKAGR